MLLLSYYLYSLAADITFPGRPIFLHSSTLTPSPYDIMNIDEQTSNIRLCVERLGDADSAAMQRWWSATRRAEEDIIDLFCDIEAQNAQQIHHTVGHIGLQVAMLEMARAQAIDKLRSVGDNATARLPPFEQGILSAILRDDFHRVMRPILRILKALRDSVMKALEEQDGKIGGGNKEPALFEVLGKRVGWLRQLVGKIARVDASLAQRIEMERQGLDMYLDPEDKEKLAALRSGPNHRRDRAGSASFSSSSSPTQRFANLADVTSDDYDYDMFIVQTQTRSAATTDAAQPIKSSSVRFHL